MIYAAYVLPYIYLPNNLKKDFKVSISNHILIENIIIKLILSIGEIVSGGNMKNGEILFLMKNTIELINIVIRLVRHSTKGIWKDINL